MPTAPARTSCPPPKKQPAGSCCSTASSKAGWHAYNKQSDEFWAIDGCTLKTVGTKDNYGADTRADLVTDKEYTNFELTLDWKATKGGNSGVIYGIVEDPKYKTPMGHGT